MADNPKDADAEVQSITFAGFRLDRKRREVWYGEDLLAATERTFEFLWLLAAQQGELVGKNDLLEQLWPDQYVTEASLSRLVSDTRQLLGQYEADADLIQTVRGRGFRLRADVVLDSAASTPSAATANAQPSTPSKVPWIAAAAALLLILGASLWLMPATDVGPGTAELDIEGAILVLPVQVQTGDDQDNWVQYGIMAMLTQQLQGYERLAVIGAGSALKGLAQIGVEPETLAADGALDSDTFGHICNALGCKQLVSPRLELENDQLVLQYRLYRAEQSSPVYRFVSNDAMDAAEMLSEHLVAKLIPNARERLDVQPFYSDNAVANRNLALGVSSLYHADYTDARIYLELALRHKPGFLWAQFFLADTALRVGELQNAQEILDLMEQQPLSTRQALEVGRLHSNLLYAQGELAASQEVSLQTLSIAEAIGDHENRGMALMNTGSSYTAMGDAQNAQIYLKQAMGVFSQHGFMLRHAQAQLNLANAIRVADGDLDEIADHYRQAAAGFLNCNAEAYLAFALRGLGDVNRSRGRYTEAREQFDRVLEISRKVDDVEGELFVEMDLSNLAIDLNQWEEAERRARMVYQRSADQFTYLRAYSAAVLVQVYLRIEKLDAVPDLLTEIRSVEWYDPRPSIALLPASFAHRSGRLEEAVELTKALRVELGEDAWTPAHAQFLELFERSVTAGKPLPMDYIKGLALSE